MATTITRASMALPQRITLSATPGTATQVNIPNQARRVELLFLTSTSNDTPVTGEWARAGTDNATIDSGHAQQVAGAKENIILSGRARLNTSGYTIYVASSTASAVAEVTCYEA